MGNVMALVSKAMFEAQHRAAKVGDVLGMDRFVSTHGGLAPLSDGGALFLVTVRPPDEALWLVAVLEHPDFDRKQWVARTNTVPVRDLAAIKRKLKFSSGNGLSSKAGALGMSLQTPRTLTDEDVSLLRGGRAPAPTREPRRPPEAKRPAPKLPPAAPSDDALDRAAAALAAGDREGALGSLVDAWRACRAPELAELIDIVSEDATRGSNPIPTDDEDFVATWMEVEVLGRAVDIPRLIPGLYAEPIGSLGDRVAALIARGPDPRVGRALVRFVDEIPTTASSRFHVWKAIFGALPTMVDRASAADFARFRKKKNEGGGFYPRYFNWLAKLTLPEVAQLDAPAKKRVAALTKVARALGRGKPAAFAVAPAKPTRDAMELDLEPTQAMKVAHDAMRANDHERAMRHLLAAWESTRDDDLANLIDELTLALYPRLDRAPGDHRAWLKREATGAALDVQHLLDARTEGTMSELAMKLGRLLARPADPRIGRLLVKVIDESYGVTNDDYWKASLDLVAKSGSPTCLAELESYTADITRNVSHFPHWRPRQRHTVRVIDDLRARMSSLRPLPTEARAVISRIRAAFPEAPKHPEASLIADIVEAPEDDGPRLVFADWLMERGDALGEWISLQCGLAKDPTNKKLLARQKALIKTNRDRDALVGPLRAIIDNDPTFRRGMLASITARGDDKSDRLLHTHPRLATVEELDLWWVEHDTAISFARSPALVSLRKLRHVHATVFLALAASPLPLVVEHIEIGIGNDQEGPIASADRKLFVDAPGLPHVRTVDVWHEGSPIPAWFLDGALARRLVKIECVESDIDAWRAAIKKRRLSIVVGPSPSK